MKKILIVCIQGVTSSVMAKKLNILAKEKNESYQFMAVGIEDIHRYLEGADYILLTPQVKSKMKEIEREIENTTCEIGLIGDNSISFNHIELTYHNLKEIVEKPNINPPLIPVLIKTLKETLIFIFCIYIVGMLLRYLYSMTDIDILDDIYLKTSGILCIYVAYFTGGSFAKKMHQSSFMYGCICILSLLMFSTTFVGSTNTMYKYPDIGPEVLLVISEYGTKHMLLYLLLIVFSVLIFHGLNMFVIKKCKEKHYLLMGYFNMPNYILMSVYLIMMTIFYYFIHQLF